MKQLVNTRSYDVTTKEGKTYRRNRRHLRSSKEILRPDVEHDLPEEMYREPHVDQEMPAEYPPMVPPEEPPESTPMTKSRSGRQVTIPSRFRDFDLSK